MIKFLPACVIAGSVLVAACGGGGEQQQAQGTDPADRELSAIPLGKEQPIRSVNSVSLRWDRATPGAMKITASGTVWSSGWTAARLLPLVGNAANATTHAYRFVATSPSAQLVRGTSRPANVTLRVAAFPQTVKAVRILAGTNEISVAVPPPLPTQSANAE